MYSCAKSFHEKALDRCDPVTKDMLVDVSLHEMIDGHQIYLDNLSFSFFLRLKEAARSTNDSIRKTLSMIRSMLKKMHVIPAVEEIKEVKSSSLRKTPYNRREIERFRLFPPFPCEAKKAKALLEKWIKENAIHLLEQNPLLL